MDFLDRARRIGLCLLCLSGQARSENFQASHNLDIYSGPVIATARITGLGGAYTAVAEDQDGQPYNPAALAQRYRHLNRSFDLDWVFTTHLAGLSEIQKLDLDNSGRPTPSLTSAANVQLGASFQIRRFGMGILVALNNNEALTPGGQKIGFNSVDLSFGAAYGFSTEQLLLGAEVVIGGLALDAPNADSTATASIGYGNIRPRFGALWRPEGQLFRLGIRYDPGTLVARPDDVPPLAESLALPAGASFPSTLNLGAAMWVGPDADLLNEPSPIARRERGLTGPPRRATSRLQPVLLSFQLDLISSSAQAVTPSSFVLQKALADAVRSGAHFSVAPHFGAEWEILRPWIIVRGGTYLEPSRTTAGSRPHATFGMDVRIPAYFVNLRGSIGGDVAPRYQRLALSIGFWHDLAPNHVDYP